MRNPPLILAVLIVVYAITLLIFGLITTGWGTSLILPPINT